MFAKVGLRKDPVERINVDPSTILVPAALPQEVEDQMAPAPYAFSSMLTYSQRKKNAVPSLDDGTRLMAQDLYSPTRRTFASPVVNKHRGLGEEEGGDDDGYDPDGSLVGGGDSLEEHSTLSSFPSFSDTASHGMGIASRAMKLVATGATSSFGRAERFAEEARNRRKVRIDRFYDVDGGNKCSLAKSVSNSLYGSAMAHNQAPRFPRPSPQLAQPDTVGPGSYKVNYGIVSTKISDRWDLQSSSFKGIQRKNTGKRRNGLNGSQSEPALLLQSGVSIGKSPFSKTPRTRAEEMSTTHTRRVGQAKLRQQLQSNRKEKGGSSMRVLGVHQTTPEQRLSQTSWTNDSKAWAAKEGHTKLANNLVIEIGKTPAVSPEISPRLLAGLSVGSTEETSGVGGGGSVVHMEAGGKQGESVGSLGQASIVSINAFMADKF